MKKNKTNEVKITIDPKTGMAKGNLFKKSKTVVSNNPKVKAGKTFSGKLNLRKTSTDISSLKPGQTTSGVISKKQN